MGHAVTVAVVDVLDKKGDPDKQSNYRPISLFNILYKLLESVL